jgi:hypothetical protein
VVVVVMQARGFPWLSHRTLAQVRQTEELTAKSDRGERFERSEITEFRILLVRSRKNNPPPADEKAGAA